MRIPLALIFFFSIHLLCATNFSEVDSLIGSKRYLDAWKKLDSIENNENKIEVNLRKIDLCLKYHVKSISHQAFAFVNVPKGENLLQQKQLASQKMISVFPFKIDAIIDSLITESPNNYALYKTKGDYYYDIFILYGRKWVKNKHEVLRLMHDSFKKADENGVRDYLSLYALGYFYTLNEQANLAFQYFERSLKLDSSYAPTHYNIAYLYAERDSNQKALSHALMAFKLYKYIVYKCDAGQMAGNLLNKLGNHKEAISILLKCDQMIPGNYQVYRTLLSSFLALDQLAKARITTESMFSIDWKSHAINTDLIELYVQTNYLDELLSFYQQKLTNESYNMEYRGHIQLHIAQAYELANNLKEKLTYINLARTSFHICYDEGHPVFGVLAKMEK